MPFWRMAEFTRVEQMGGTLLLQSHSRSTLLQHFSETHLRRILQRCKQRFQRKAPSSNTQARGCHDVGPARRVLGRSRAAASGGGSPHDARERRALRLRLPRRGPACLPLPQVTQSTSRHLLVVLFIRLPDDTRESYYYTYHDVALPFRLSTNSVRSV